MSKSLSRNQILKAKPKLERIDVPEWDGHIHLKALTVKEVLSQQSALKADTDESAAILVAFSACDENGVRLFKVEDIPALAEQSARAISRIAEAAARVNGFSTQSIDEKKSD